MAAGAKNLEQIMLLTEQGLLPPCAAICDIGASQLQGAAIGEGIASFLDYYARRTDRATPSARLTREQLSALADRGFLGDLCELAGFRYVALDIFHAKNTILFDLNAHRPGPELKQKFDLVLNFGTTEHVVNQLAAHGAIYDLTRIGGVMYHDLPMSGYWGHGYFKYDPKFFVDLAAANGCDVVLDRLSKGALQPGPDFAGQGADWRDYGVEFAMQRRAAGGMRLPLETSTSLSVDPDFATADSAQVQPIGAYVIDYAPIAADREAPTLIVAPAPAPRPSWLKRLLSRPDAARTEVPE